MSMVRGRGVALDLMCMQMRRGTLFVCMDAVGWDGHDFTECVRNPAPPPLPPPFTLSRGLFLGPSACVCARGCGGGR